MKANVSFEHPPLGLVGHLRAAVEAWQHERALQKAIDATAEHHDGPSDSVSHLTAAELYESRRDAAGGLTETGDVLTGLVLNWPSPSNRQH